MRNSSRMFGLSSFIIREVSQEIFQSCTLFQITWNDRFHSHYYATLQLDTILQKLIRKMFQLLFFVFGVISFPSTVSPSWSIRIIKPISLWKGHGPLRHQWNVKMCEVIVAYHGYLVISLYYMHYVFNRAVFCFVFHIFQFCQFVFFPQHSQTESGGDTAEFHEC